MKNVILKPVNEEKGYLIDDDFVNKVIGKNIEMNGINKQGVTAKQLYANVISTFLETYEQKQELTIVGLVQKMHNKFGITHDKVAFSKEEKEFRIAAMREEIDEYIESETKEDELDAIVDLIVFALGTLERSGMINVFEEAFKRVMEANMKKELGGNQKRGSFKLDLKKPEGWTAPDLSDLVNEN